MKKTYLMFFFSLIFSFSNAQISGISASKLLTLNTSTVKKSTIEFEPAFGITHAYSHWQSDCSNIKLDSTFNNNSFSFRFSFGLSKKIETGFAVPTDMSELSWGTKFKFYEKNKVSFALIFGLNFNFETQNILSEAGIGGVSTIQYSENFSTDVDFHYLKNIAPDRKLSNQIFGGIDNGIYINNVQYILGLNYQYAIEGNQISENIFVSPGLTVEPANNFLFVIGTPISIYGKNDFQFFNFNFALTITIE